MEDQQNLDNLVERNLELIAALKFIKEAQELKDSYKLTLEKIKEVLE